MEKPYPLAASSKSAQIWERWFIPALLVLALFGVLAILKSTPYGPGLVNDSATYIEGAANLLSKQGYVRISGGGEIKPITHFPPLFSILLALLGLLGIELVTAARWLIALLFGVSILLVGLSTYRLSRSAPFALLGAFLLATSDLHLGVYVMALSEPLFLSLALGAYLLLDEYYQSKKRRWLILSGFFLSLALLTRYAGISLYLSSCLAILLFTPTHGSKLIEKWRQVLPLLLSSIPLPLLWAIYQANNDAGLGNRQIAWHPQPFWRYFEALKNLLSWVAPDDLLAAAPLSGRLLSGLSLLVLPLLLSWLLWQWKHWGPQRFSEKTPFLAILLTLHIPIYLGFLTVSLTLFDASTPLDDRILSIIYLPEIVLLVSGLSWLWRRFRAWRYPIGRWAILLFTASLMLTSVLDGIAAVNQLSRQGLGFSHQVWRQSPAVPAIRSLPFSTLYSNKPGAVYLLTGRNAYVTPTPLDPVTDQERPNYLENLNEMQERVRRGEAALILFGLHQSQDPEEILLFETLTAGLPQIADYGEVVIFGILP